MDLVGELFEHRFYGELGRRIMSRERTDDTPELARDGEDVSPTRGRAWRATRRAGEAMVAEDIGVEGEASGLQVLHLDRPRNADPRIVHQHIQRASGSLLRFRYRAVCHVFVEHIEFDHGDIELLIASELTEFVRLGSRQVAHSCKDLGSEPCVVFRAEPAEPR